MRARASSPAVARGSSTRRTERWRSRLITLASSDISAPCLGAIVWRYRGQFVQSGGYLLRSMRRCEPEGGVYRLFDRGRTQVFTSHVRCLLIDINQMLCHAIYISTYIYGSPGYIHNPGLRLYVRDGSPRRSRPERASRSAHRTGVPRRTARHGKAAKSCPECRPDRRQHTSRWPSPRTTG